MTKAELQKRIEFLEATLDRRTHELTREIAEYVIIRADLDKRTRELSQRLKELNCMVQISKLSEQYEISFEIYIQKTLDIIISSFERYDIACAELKLGEEHFRSANFHKSEWKLGRGLMDNEKMIGFLTIYYSENPGDKDFAPFTREEKNFLIMITRYLVQIFKRKKYEEELLIFREVISQSPSMIIITDQEGKTEYVNRALEETLGFNLKELRGKINRLVLEKDQSDPGYLQMIEALYRQEVFKGEFIVSKKDGSPIWVRANVSPVIKKDATLAYMSVFDDITAEREAKRLIWEQQERYRTLVENSPASISLVDRTGRYLYVNKQAEIDLEVPVGKLVGKKVSDIFKPSEAKNIMNMLSKIFREKKGIRIETSYNIHGKIKHFDITRQPIIDNNGEVTMVMSIVNNITDRILMDGLIKFQHSIDSLQSISDTFEKSLERLFDNLFTVQWINAGGLYVFNKERNNLELVYHRGLSEDFVRGSANYPMDSGNVAIVLQRKARYSSVLHLLPESRELIVGEGLKFTCVLPLVFQDRVIGCLNLASTTVDNLTDFERMSIESIAGRVATVIALAQAQENLKKSNDELAGALKSLQENRQLLIQKSRLESLGELSAGLSHEINQPLSVISLAIENLELSLKRGKADKEYLVRKFGSIAGNIGKIKELIDHVRLFSRDQKENVVQRVDVNKAVRDALSLITEQLRSHRITVKLDLGKGLGVVLGNQSRMEQVFLNLLSNARDALDQKEKVGTNPGLLKEIRITTNMVRKDVVIVFWDNGTGMVKENLERMFDPFFTTKPAGYGTGLGLSIVYGIIREMNGAVLVRSVSGKYMRITIRIPAHKIREANS